ncbi:MAG: hypothetical protein ABIC19_04405 [Patescibacteria group bacterium]
MKRKIKASFVLHHLSWALLIYYFLLLTADIVSRGAISRLVKPGLILGLIFISMFLLTLFKNKPQDRPLTPNIASILILAAGAIIFLSFTATNIIISIVLAAATTLILLSNKNQLQKTD